MGIMGLSTFLVGLLPSYASAGVAAPVALVTLRLLQGLALGGEYGGAATYVAEHAPPGRRGFYTSWIQTTATLGLFAALLVVIGTRTALGEEAFADWGWRVPFLLSILLLGGVAVDPDAARGEPGLPEDEGGRHDLEGAAARELRALGQCAGSSSSPCSAPSPARRWSGIPGNSTPSSSSRRRSRSTAPPPTS